MCNIIKKYGFHSYRYRFINLFKLLLYFYKSGYTIYNLSVQFHEVEII